VSARKPLRRWRIRVRDRLYDWRWVAIATFLNRFAPAELRHAALLLGYDAGMGYGTVVPFLGHLHEFHTGFHLADAVRYGEVETGISPARAADMFRLERSLFGIIPDLVAQ
jgi:hypothetical protein